MKMISDYLVEKVLKAVNPEEVVNLTAELVKINSVWDPDAGTSEQAAAEHAAAWAEAQGFVVAMEDGRPRAAQRDRDTCGRQRAPHPHVRGPHGRGHPRGCVHLDA